MKRALFVTPAVPSPTGSGLRMRAWLFLNALARHYSVTVVAGSPSFPDEAKQEPLPEHLAARTIVIPFDAWRDPAIARRRVAERILRGGSSGLWEPTPRQFARVASLSSQEFDLVHVFRLYMLPLALAITGGRYAETMQLDLDDWESDTRRAIAAIVREPARAQQLRRSARRFELEEALHLPRMARVFVCSHEDAVALAAKHGLQNVVVQENAVDVPPTQVPAGSSNDFLFIGALAYPPNEHGVRFLLRDVLPRVRRQPAVEARLLVAGAAPPAALAREMAEAGDVTYVGAAPSVEALYARCAAALAPIFAGGGTRVKALEAFAQSRPLIATSRAVAGLGVVAGEHYLEAETADEWCSAMTRLLTEPETARSLADRAYAWVASRSLDRAIDQLAARTQAGQ